jgi:rubrerythrin
MTHGSSNTQPDLDLDRVTADFSQTQWTCVVCGGAEEIAPDEEAPAPPVCPSCHNLAVAEALAGLRGVRR